MKAFRLMKIVTEPNADLILEAGEEIDLKPGTHIKAGAKAHLWIHYEKCDNVPRPCSVSSLPQTNTTHANNPTEIQRKSEQEKDRANLPSKENTINVYPNPTRQSFTIVSKESIIASIDIYSIMGRKVGEISHVNSKRFHYTKPINTGAYILIIKDKDGKVYHKKIVIL